MNSPKLVVRTGYKLSLNNHDRSKLFNSRDTKYVDGILDYYKEDKKRIINMIDYFTGKINKHEDINLVLENGNHATEKDIENRKKYIKKQFNNSNVWQIVLSIDKKLVDQNISWDDLEKKLATKILPEFFKSMGFVDTNKMCYQFSLHTNTNHPHFHISFLEKAPNTREHNNSISYRRFGKIPAKAINTLKRETMVVIERENKFRPLATNINKDIEEIKQLFDPKTKNYILYDRQNIFLEEKIIRLGKLLNERNFSYNSRIKFNSIKDIEIKELTKKISDDLFKVNKQLKNYKSEFNKSIKEMNNYFTNLNTRNNLSLKDVDLTYSENKEIYLNNFVLNAIVNHARYKYDKNINKCIDKEDIIQSIIINSIKEDEEYSKQDIVKRSLSNSGLSKYRFQQEIYNAIRSIDRELNEASLEYERIMKNKPKEKVRWY